MFGGVTYQNLVKFGPVVFEKSRTTDRETDRETDGHVTKGGFSPEPSRGLMAARSNSIFSKTAGWNHLIFLCEYRLGYYTVVTLFKFYLHQPEVEF